MLKNYLLITLRNLQRRPGFAFVNVFGLAAGLACTLLIGLYVHDEFAFDGFHEAADRTYRVVTVVEPPEGDLSFNSGNGWPLAPAIQAAYPEVEAITSIRTWSPSVKHEGRYGYPRTLWADAAFFDVFSFPLRAGDPATALQAPYSLVLSDVAAQRYFGTADALGRTLVLNDTLTFTVTGVAEVPEHSHIQFDALAASPTFHTLYPGFDPSQQWFTLQVFNYLRLQEGARSQAFANKLGTLYDRHFGEWNGYRLEARIEPLRDVYLRSPAGNGLGPRGNVEYAYLLGAIAVFVLLIAGINFTNLATARALERAKEVGVRKTVGSTRGSLVQQFLLESIVTAALALLVGLGLVSLVLPYFNDLAGKSLVLRDLAGLEVGLLLLGLVGVVGLAAGLYPALVLARHRPVDVLKGRYATGRQGVRLRQALVVCQFALSCGLIICTLAVAEQLRFMQAQELGFDEEQVLVVDASAAPGRVRTAQADAFEQALAAHAGVEVASLAGALPGRAGWRGQVTFPADRPDAGIGMEHVMADADYVRALGLRIVAGRDVSAERPSDAEGALLLNEAGAKAFGWTPEEALGQRLVSPGTGFDAEVVGVVADYHQHGLQERIPPLAVMQINPWNRPLAVLRIDPRQAEAVLDHAEAVWAGFFPGYDFDAFFLDDAFGQAYAQEQRLARIFGTFAALAILIACLGLFALAAYATAQRTKEIGVRKVFGATVPGLVALLTRDFLALVGVAFVVAAPVAYLAMDRWLDGFAYRTDLGAGVFLLAAALALVVAFLTVSVRALRAASANPMNALRYE